MPGGSPSSWGASLFGVTMLCFILSFDLLDAGGTFYPSCDNMSPDIVSCPQEGSAVPGWELLLYRMVLRAERLSLWSITRLG